MKKRIISALCSLSMLCSGIIAPLTGSTASAAATDVSQYRTYSSTAMEKNSGTYVQTEDGYSFTGTCVASAGSTNHFASINLAVNKKEPGIREKVSADKTYAHIGFNVANSDKDNDVLYIRSQDNTAKDTRVNTKTELSKTDLSDYRIDLYFSLADCSYSLYVDSKKVKTGTIFRTGATSAKRILFTMIGSTEYEISFSDVIYELYSNSANMQDIIAATLPSNLNHELWTVSGIDGDDYLGTPFAWNNSVEALPGNNNDGYIIKAAPSGSGKKTPSGYGYWLGNGAKVALDRDQNNDSVIHQHFTLIPNVSDGNLGTIGIRGNDGYEYGYVEISNDDFVNGREYGMDILINNKDFKYYILADGQLKGKGTIYEKRSPLWGITYGFRKLGDDTMIIKDVTTTKYDPTVSLDAKLAELTDNTSNCIWSFGGIFLAGGSPMVGGYSSPNNYASISGNNRTGYTITATSNAGIIRYRLGKGDRVALERNTAENNIIHQSFKFTPNFTSGNTEQIGIRGNDGYYYCMDVSAEKGFVSRQEYDVDFLINNKDFRYNIIVDGEVKASGTISSVRSPLWEIVYKVNTAGDSMVLKNVQTKYYKNTVSMADKLLELCPNNFGWSKYRFETNSDGYADYEVENAPCFDTSVYEIESNTRMFSGKKAVSVTKENKNTPTDDEIPTMNLSFTANRPGTNKYYLWLRHTASIAQEDGRNCFLSLTENGAYDYYTFTGERNAPQWALLGTVEAAEGETGFVRIRQRQASHISFDRYVITADPNFVPTDAYYQIYPPASSRAKDMGTLSNGRLVFEAEDAGYGNYDLLDSVLDGNTYDWYSSYSGNKGLMKSSHSDVIPTNWKEADGIDAGDIEFNFTPDESGKAYLWVRYYSSSKNKKFAVSVNSNDYVSQNFKEEGSLKWQRIAEINSIKKDVPVNVRIKDITGGYAVDEFAITSSTFDTPSGSEPSWDVTSTTLTGGSPQIAASSLPQHPRLILKSGEESKIRTAQDAAQNKTMRDRNNDLISKGLAEDFTGYIPSAPGYANNNEKTVAKIEALAYDYAINGNDDSGYKAALSAVNYITNVSYAGISGEDYVRKAGHDLYMLSKAYDWAYEFFTEEQRTAFVNSAIEIAYQFDNTWPSSSSNSVTGFGAEGKTQMYLLAFAIAVANERPDIYNNIVGTVESEFVPSNIAIYSSGYALNGSRYGTFRGQNAFASALMLKTIGYENDALYKALSESVFNYIYARRPDGLMFADGDDTNDGKTPYSYYNVGHMKNMFLYAMKLFGNEYGVGSDSYFKDAARWACASTSKDFANFDESYGEGYISPATFLVVNSDANDDSFGAEQTASLPLSRYFGSYSGSMLARTGWTDMTNDKVNSLDQNDNTAVAYMKTGVGRVGNHQHLDAGNFQLYYKGILANDSSYYNGSNYSSSYMDGYARRSAAHNVLLVKDGISNKLGDISYADGGQQPYDAATNVSNIKTVATVLAHDMAGDDVNQPDFTYLKSDLTGAYHSNSVSNYKRSFVFMNMADNDEPGALIVFDRVETKSSDSKTSWLLHGINQPSVSGKRAVFTNNNGGQMTNDTLRPNSIETNMYKDGFVDTDHNYSSGYTAEAGKVCESDGYRLEVSPALDGTVTRYLNVIQLGDEGTTAVQPTAIENDTFLGAVLKDRVVLFSRNGDFIAAGDANKTTTSYSFNFSSNDGYVYKIAMADAATGSYQVYYKETENGEETLIAYPKTTADGHMITFEGRAGYYRVIRMSNTTKVSETSYAEEDTLKLKTPGVKVIQSNGAYKVSVSPKSYRSYAVKDNNEYANKILIAVYDGNGKVLGIKGIDFTKTDKDADYIDVATVDASQLNKLKVKTFIFDDLSNIKPLTKFGEVTVH